MNRITFTLSVILLAVVSGRADETHRIGGQGSQDHATDVEAATRVPSTDAKPIDAAGFEDAKPGPFDQLETGIGLWRPEDGQTIVDDKHAKTGKQCLQLTGGEKTTVTLDLQANLDTPGRLSFWAERWTSRKPFQFRIEKRIRDGWQEIYNGDAEVRVGRAFLNHVQVSLGGSDTKQLRFTCTSPPNTGVLLDDVRITPARPQKLLHVEAVPVTLPALVGTEICPLVKLKVVTTGHLQPLLLTSLKTKLLGDVTSADFTKLFVYSERWDARFAEQSWGRPNSDHRTDGDAGDTVSVYQAPADAGVVLEEGENTLWIACRLAQDADIDHKLGVQLQEVAFSNGQTIKLDARPSVQRLGVAVRQRGDDGNHTYRIPGLATTNNGTLIGVYDIRRRGGGDLPGDIDVGMSRSTDGGRTWEPMKVIMDMGDDPKWRYDGIGDPAVLVDTKTGTVWVAATWSHGNRSWRGSGPGMKPDETGQLMLVRSDDDGITWSKPINITRQVKKPEWSFILQGPGKGITMLDGTIVFAAQYQDAPNEANKQAHRLPHSTIIYSEDHGKTWQVGTGAFDDTTESQVVEVEPGVLMLNCRYNRNGTRVVMTTRDRGETWKKHTTSERDLIEPGACMASLIDVKRETDGQSGDWLLFSNPDSTRGRDHLTIKASPDRGRTWPQKHRLLLDEERSAGYSCLSMIDERTVGILYEGSQAHMTFQRIPLSDLVGTRAEKTAKTPKPTLRLPRVFGDHMVLQAGTEIPVWGNAQPDARVTVTFDDETQHTTADKHGAWKVRLKSRTTRTTSATMKVQSADERITFHDILVGEVWLCAGQSNMEWMLTQSASGNEELANADHPQLRLLHLIGGARGSSGSYQAEHLARLEPAAFCQGQWKVASRESAQRFSAVAWHFGRSLRQQLGSPIGLICPAIGGTPTEAWVPREALQNDPTLKGLVAGNWLDNERLSQFCRARGEQNLLAAIQAGAPVPSDEFGPHHSFKPGFMWDAAIEPLIPYAIRGAIWYQGESNAETAARVCEHDRLLPLLIHEWRARWKQAHSGQRNFPFLYVQLPALNRREWPSFREGQRRMLNRVENTGMAIVIDTGDPSNVHPTEKKLVGKRLAMWALGTTYAQLSTYSGPLVDVARREGNAILVVFKHVGGGLKSSDRQPLRHFEVCGSDRIFHEADAEITGKNTLLVSSSSVSHPIGVRYAWLPYPDPPVNLFNDADLPASPFSTETTLK